MQRTLHKTVIALWALSLLVNTLLLLAPAPAARAQGPSPFEVVASNLNNPRGLTFGSDGALYIAEAGRGGAGPCRAGPEGGEECYGATGSITRVQGGTQTRVVSGLPSLATQQGSQQPPTPPGSQATGPHDVAIAGTTLYATVGWGGPPISRTVEADFGNFGHVFSATLAGPSAPMLDLAAYEDAANPDGTPPPDSNPYSILVEGDGGMVAVDAGGNSLLLIEAGEVVTHTVFPTRTVPFPPGSPNQIPMQSVPTSVAVGPDGAYYVAELTGFPFPQGGARVYRVEAIGQPPELYAEGFTNVVDLAFDATGNLYVVEFATNGLLSGDVTGAIKRVPAGGGTPETVVSEGLTAPGGIAIGEDGYLYVSNWSILPDGQQLAGGGPPSGEVVRINPENPTALTLGTLNAQTSGNPTSNLFARSALNAFIGWGTVLVLFGLTLRALRVRRGRL